MIVEPGPDKRRPRAIYMTDGQRVLMDEADFVTACEDIALAWDAADPGDVIVPAAPLLVLIDRTSTHDPVAVNAADELRDVLDERERNTR